MALSSVELREQRHKLIVDARELLEKAESEKRSLSQEEDAQYQKMFSDAEELKKRAERIESLEKEEKEALEIRGVTFADRKEVEKSEKEDEKEVRSRAFKNYILGGFNSLKPEESRALQMDVNDKGGFLVAPQEFMSSVLQKVDDLLFIRNVATVFQLNGAHSLGYPSLETDPADADWTGEITEAAEGTLDFGKRELKPHPLSKLVKVSRKLIRHSTQSVEAIVSERMAYKLAVPQEKGFLVGTGANQPLGVFTASANGISTGRDVSTGNTTSAVTFDGLKSAKGALKRQYRSAAQWVMHRDLHTQITKIKDGEGRYIWQDSVVAHEPDVLLGFPVNESEYAPNTFTTGQYVAVLGNWSFYHIAESLRVEMQRLDELFARTNQIGFITRSEIDGMPALEEAFVRVKLA
jgi:HK97 family phage major capsid protein